MAQGTGELGAGPAFLIGFCLGAVALLIGVTLVFDLKITRSFMHPGLTRREYFRANPSQRVVMLVVGSIFLFGGSVFLLAMLTVAMQSLTD
ncbi:hypothetical protein ACFZAU_12015 [Streptomyces sp. NPDC008238]